jgi:hypothetical protein
VNKLSPERAHPIAALVIARCWPGRSVWCCWLVGTASRQSCQLWQYAKRRFVSRLPATYLPRLCHGVVDRPDLVPRLAATVAGLGVVLRDRSASQRSAMAANVWQSVC